MYLMNDIQLKLVWKTTKNKWDPKCEILLHGKPTDKYIDGALLEAAIRWQTKALLFVTYGCPAEERLGILLLDRQLNVVDRALMFWQHNTGSFKKLELIEPDTLKFRFFAGNPWEIQLLAKPKTCLPYFTEPFGVLRPLGFSRHFIVHTIQKKTTAHEQRLPWKL